MHELFNLFNVFSDWFLLSTTEELAEGSEYVFWAISILHYMITPAIDITLIILTAFAAPRYQLNRTEQQPPTLCRACCVQESTAESSAPIGVIYDGYGVGYPHF